jgi:hypothetical protein
MPQTLRWIITASLLVQIAKCDAIPANVFLAFTYADQSNISRFRFSTAIPPQTLLLTSVFPSKPAGLRRQVPSPTFVLFLALPDSHSNYRVGGQHENGVEAVFWRFVKSIIGVNLGPCATEWTRGCQHAFANPSYRPTPKKK